MPENGMGIAFAMIPDGDALYVARPNRLDRLDRATGKLETVAGPEWNVCPRDPSLHWLSAPKDFSYPQLAIRGNAAYLVDKYCGLWSFDLASKTARLFADPTIEAKIALQETTGTMPRGKIWNGKEGPNWNNYYGMSLAPDGDGLLACFSSSVDVDEESPSERKTWMTRFRIELWSIATDGTLRELLGFVTRERADEDGSDYCRSILPEPESIILSTDKAILRFDRATKTFTQLVGGFKLHPGPVFADVTDLFFEKNNAVVRMPRSGGAEVTLHAGDPLDPLDPVRNIAGVDGDYVYFNEGYGLRRVRKDGTDLVDFAFGSWGKTVVFPRLLGVGSEHVYYQKVVKVANNDNVDDHLGTLYRALK